MRTFPFVARALMLWALVALCGNDAVRCAMPPDWYTATANQRSADDNPVNPFAFVEEEVKHPAPRLLFLPTLPPAPLPSRSPLPENCQTPPAEAFLAIFSPPPNAA